ncbi:MAG TPA: sugar ABC transporter ATP-binding protein, partial [Fimbriimonas sp.]|nr:sugar ABC transporter ATP-binding protein [Fimbriimonas sp.]
MIVQLRGIGKKYGDISVLRNIDLDLFAGEVHVLAGENGAGKSTLIKILGGVLSEYEGSYLLGGSEVHFCSSRDAMKAGVAVIHQELSLVPCMSIADNLLLGDFPHKAGFIDQKQVLETASQALKKVGVVDPLSTPVSQLPIATQQLIEIAKALRHEAKLVIMDEPTSALNAQEAERLFALIAELKAQGVAIVYITHKMDEIERLADRITVLRDGELVVTAEKLTHSEIVRHMVGRELSEYDAAEAVHGGDTVLELKQFSVYNKRKCVIADLDLSVAEGEVVGLAGLEGSGNSDLLHGIFGNASRTTGELRLGGEPVRLNGPNDAVHHRLALVTNDRKATGLVLDMEVGHNMTLTTFRRFFPMGWHQQKRETEHQTELGKKLNVKSPSLTHAVGQLSGGNQQKVVLAKWVDTQPRLLMLDEPTRGIDVGAKRDIYEHIARWKAQGMAILLISSELDELLRLSD